MVKSYWNMSQFIKDFSSNRKKGKLLDIGCGTGEFLFVASGMGYDVEGIDFNKNAITFAKQKLGLSNVFATNLYDFLKDKKERYDIVTIFEVIEHVSDPGTFIDLARSALKKGGLLVISTPNRERYWGRINPDLEPWDFPYQHLLRWNQNSLNTFITKRGFKVVITRKQRYPIDWFVAKLRKMAAKLVRKKDKVSHSEIIRDKIGFSRYHLMKRIIIFLCNIPAFIMASLFRFEGLDLYSVLEKQ